MSASAHGMLFCVLLVYRYLFRTETIQRGFYGKGTKGQGARRPHDPEDRLTQPGRSAPANTFAFACCDKEDEEEKKALRATLHHTI